MRILPYGDAAVLVELDDLGQALGLQRALLGHRPPGIVDLVPATRTLLIRIDPAVTSPAQIRRVLAGLQPGCNERRETRSIEVPVVYDGVDLAAVGELTGLGERGVVAAHTEQTWTVAFAGFAPGFGYLAGEDDRLAVSRLDDPRTTVPAGSIGLAGAFSGIYPRASPGGWRLIGRTDLAMWQVDRDPPALLEPGVRVRFLKVT